MQITDLEFDSSIFSEVSPIVSIIVPVYNTRNYLSLCIDSIISQRHEDIEIILVDDGSDDGSELLCDQYSERFPHFIKVIHKANQGPLLARVDGFRMACGDYAMTVDSDDALLPGSLDSLIRAIQETDDDVIVWGYTQNEDSLLSEAISGVFDYSEPSKLSMLKLLCSSSSQNAMWRKAVRRGCLCLDVDFLPYAGMRFAEDFLQTVLIYDCAETFCVIHNSLYYYRSNPDGVTNVSFSKEYYLDSIGAITTAEPYARHWEREFGCSNLVTSLSGQGLWHTAKYAVQLVKDSNLEELCELSFSEFFRSRYTNHVLATLRMDKRLILYLLKSGKWCLLKIVVEFSKRLHDVKRES